VRTTITSKWALTAMGALMLSVGCSGSGNGKSPSEIALGFLSDIEGLTVLAQRVPALDGGAEVVPGQANCWDLAEDFALESGCDEQFDGALGLTVDDGAGDDAAFPDNQSYDDISFFTPEFSRVDDVVVSALESDPEKVLNGSYSAVLAPTHAASLRQVIDLFDAVPPITLTYEAEVEASPGDIPGEDWSFAVQVRDADDFTTTLYRDDQDGETGTLGTHDLSAFAGEKLVVFFRQRSAAWGATWIDDVSVMDDDGTEFVTNGGFEFGNATSWSEGSIQTVRNLTSGSRTLEGLGVMRSFFSPPGSLWGRWVDVFQNDTGSEIIATVIYDTFLGSSDYGITYETPGSAGQAISSWDGDDRDGVVPLRDVGIVFGVGDASFDTSDAIGNPNGGGFVVVEFDVTVPAGERVAIVHFIVMNGVATGLTAASAADKASAIDAEVLRILDGYPDDGSVNEFTNGMTQAQIDAVLNF